MITSVNKLLPQGQIEEWSMPLFRIEVMRPRVITRVNRRAEDERGAVLWAKKKYLVKRDAITVTAVDEDDAGVIVELEKNLGESLGGPYLDWENGRVIELDLGFPHCIFGKFTDDQIEPVARLRHLRSFSLRGNLKITDAGIRVVQSLTGLKSLILDEMQIGDDCVRFLSGLVDLETLYLSKGTLADQRIKQRGFFSDPGLRTLRKLSKLRHLTVDDSNVTGSCFDVFLRLDSIEYFTCSNSRFNDRGMKNVGRMLSLRKTQLDNTNITSKGLAHLKGLKNLQKLYLRGTKITDDGLRYLRRLPSLQGLDIEETRVTPSAAEKMYQLLPAE